MVITIVTPRPPLFVGSCLFLGLEFVFFVVKRLAKFVSILFVLQIIGCCILPHSLTLCVSFKHVLWLALSIIFLHNQLIMHVSLLNGMYLCRIVGKLTGHVLKSVPLADPETVKVSS